jgi:pimeloyl-ACP methyl ester carboxylesterase
LRVGIALAGLVGGGLTGWTNLPLAADEPAQGAKALPLPGEVFVVDRQAAFLIEPKEDGARGDKPWVWYAPTLPGLPGAEETWMFRKFLDAGIAVAGIDVGESYGAPRGRAGYTALYKELVERRGFSRKPGLLARSRGGLMLYNWAVEHPDAVGCIAGIYPVCDLRSYPGVEKAAGAYGLTPQQLADELEKHNPISRVELLAQAGVPIFHMHGDMDAVVPLKQNSGALAENYRKFGGKMTLTVIKGEGHTMWPGWFQSQELVDFVVENLARKDCRDGR